MAGSANRSARNDDCSGRVLPRALDASEAGLAQFGQVRRDAFDKAIAIHEIAAWTQQIVDRAVAGENFFGVAQIVESDRGNREIKGSADLLRP